MRADFVPRGFKQGIEILNDDATPSLADAEGTAAQITTEATKQGYSLVCRPVSNGS
jgi:hypothetical protein